MEIILASDKEKKVYTVFETAKNAVTEYVILPKYIAKITTSEVHTQTKRLISEEIWGRINNIHAAQKRRPSG